MPSPWKKILHDHSYSSMNTVEASAAFLDDTEGSIFSWFSSAQHHLFPLFILTYILCIRIDFLSFSFLFGWSPSESIMIFSLKICPSPDIATAPTKSGRAVSHLPLLKCLYKPLWAWVFTASFNYKQEHSNNKVYKYPILAWVATFPDSVRHFGAPWQSFWILQVVSEWPPHR